MYELNIKTKVENLGDAQNFMRKAIMSLNTGNLKGKDWAYGQPIEDKSKAQIIEARRKLLNLFERTSSLSLEDEENGFTIEDHVWAFLDMLGDAGFNEEQTSLETPPKEEKTGAESKEEDKTTNETTTEQTPPTEPTDGVKSEITPPWEKNQSNG
jgi:hypothetical protein